MENLDLTKFSPEKAALTELATKYSSLTIAGVDDTAGYAIVDEARKDLKKKRVSITKTGKELRQEAVDFQKKVISMEKELIEIIEPLELELKAKQDVVDDAKRKALRLAALPARQEKLAKISLVMTDDEILAMSAEEFVEFYNIKNGEFLEQREQQLKEAEAKLAREKELEAAKEQARLEAIEAAKVEAARVAKESAEREARLKKEAEEAKELAAKQAEEAQAKAVKEAQEKAEAEKQKIIEDQAKAEAQRVAKELADKAAEQEKIAKEAEEQKHLEIMKEYRNFLTDHGYSEETKNDFYLIKNVPYEGNIEMVLYKKVGTFTIPSKGGQNA